MFICSAKTLYRVLENNCVRSCIVLTLVFKDRGHSKISLPYFYSLRHFDILPQFDGLFILINSDSLWFVLKKIISMLIFHILRSCNNRRRKNLLRRNYWCMRIRLCISWKSVRAAEDSRSNRLGFVSCNSKQVRTPFYQVVFLQNNTTFLRLAVHIVEQRLLSLFYSFVTQLTCVVLPHNFINVLPMTH